MDRAPILFLAGMLATASFLGIASVASTHGNHPLAPDEGISAPCFSGAQSLNTSVNWVDKTVNVLQLDPNSTGYLCLNYQFHDVMPTGFAPNIGLTKTSSSNGTFSAAMCGALNGSEFDCPGIHVSYAVGSASPPPNSLNVSVRITLDSSAKQGIYWLQIEPCSPTVLIIGQPPSKISGGYLGTTLSCVSTLNPPTIRIVGLSGISVVALNVNG